MPRKKPTTIEVLEATGEIPVVSIDIPTSYEDLVPDPVPAGQHVALNATEMISFPKPMFEKLLPIVATVFASVALGALILGMGVMIGAN